MLTVQGKINIIGIFLYVFSPPVLSGNSSISDTIPAPVPRIKNSTDTVCYRADSSMYADTLTASVEGDSIVLVPKKKKEALTSKVDYTAVDTMIINMKQEKIYLYNTAVVTYEDIQLNANYIEFDMANEVVHASGLPDTAGVIQGKPEFTQKDETFTSKTMDYNFDSHKGKIYDIITQEGEGYLHSKETKRLPNTHIHIKDGKYTTCDAEHPHFYIGLTKAIVIPEDKIISGPAYMVMEDIPLPVILPFGFFPNKNKRASGLKIPTYGEETRRGFYLRDGGWYFTLNDYIDITLLGDIYSRGPYSVKALSTYRKRYKYSGSFNATFVNNEIRNLPDQNSTKLYKIIWNHRQDPKANPTQTFTAKVDMSSTEYNQVQSYSVENYLSNTQSSSISYTKRWPNTPFNFSSSLNYSLNSKNRIVNATLPQASFSMNRIYPLRFKNRTGKIRWWENISLSYSSNLKNTITTPDSTFFTEQTLKKMRNGYQHRIPISTNIKLLKIINISPSLSYTGVLYTNYTRKYWDPFQENYDYTNPSSGIIEDTINGFKYGHSITPSFSMSLSPKIYGMFMSKKEDGYLIGIRHVMTPSVGFSFAPDVSKFMPNYWDTIYYPQYIGAEEQYHTYSIFQHGIYGTPTVRGRSASVSLSLNNNVEMKVRTRNDTTETTKKVSILDNLSFSTGYSPYATEKKWSSISMRGSTRLLNNKISLQFGSNFSPYKLDTLGRESNEYLLLNSHFTRLARLTSANFSLSTSFSSAQSKKDKPKTTAESDTENEPIVTDLIDNEHTSGYYYGDYVDFSIPWSFRIGYNFNCSKPYLAKNKTITQTASFSGDVNLTPKWKIGMNTNYDIQKRKISFTNFSIHRDLHCWEMRINVVPFGRRQSFNFMINAKASILQDLKVEKKEHWYDNF